MYQSSFQWLGAANRQPPPQTERELLIRAEALAGRSVGELAQAVGAPLPPDEKRAKGFVGQLVEYALGADPQAGDQPDFPGLGIEMKTVPIAPHGQPAESTFCCAITMAQADQERWETSRLRKKLARVLWVPVQSSKWAPLARRRFGPCTLWSPSPEEVAALRGDWEDLMGAVGRGLVVSAHEGRVLQVRPKAARAGVRTLSVGEDGPMQALPLGFYLRASFTAGLLALRAD